MSRNVTADEFDEPNVDERYVVKPVYKAMQVLRLLCEASKPLSLDEVAREAGLPKTTVFRYLHTLGIMALAEYDPAAECYRPGFGLWSLSHAADPYAALRQVCHPQMRRLQQRFNETVNLGVLSGGEVVYLEIVESERSLRMQARPGARDQIHSTALGKALLAFRPRVQWELLLPGRLIARTTNTIVDRAELMGQLEAVRKAGFASERGENEEGSLCIAAPILDTNGVSLAALSISAPEKRIDASLKAQIERDLVDCCSAISGRINKFR